MKRPRHATELVAHPAGWTRESRAQITCLQWRASIEEVRNWTRLTGFDAGTGGSIPKQAVVAYSQTYPDRRH